MAIKVTVEGKLGRDPELKGEGDKAFATFSVASERWVGEGKGDERDGRQTAYKTDWVNVICFGRTANHVANRFQKGDTIIVLTGELEVTTYEKKDREGGVIDSNATGLRVKALDVAGPFRTATKDGSNAGNGNGNGNNQQSSAPRSQSSGQQQQRSQSAQQGSNRSNTRQGGNGQSSRQAAPIDDEIPF